MSQTPIWRPCQLISSQQLPNIKLFGRTELTERRPNSGTTAVADDFVTLRTSLSRCSFADAVLCQWTSRKVHAHFTLPRMLLQHAALETPWRCAFECIGGLGRISLRAARGPRVFSRSSSTLPRTDEPPRISYLHQMRARNGNRAVPRKSPSMKMGRGMGGDAQEKSSPK